MARVTVEDCTDKIPNRFELVAIAAKRANHIGSGATITVDRDNDKDAVIALREIAQNNIDPQVIREDLISSLQTKNKVDILEKEENLHAESREDIDETNYAEESSELFVSDHHADLDQDIYSNEESDLSDLNKE